MRSVSVVIPARDDAAALGRAVNSCLAQDGVTVCEIVIAVGPSSDATEEVARDHAAEHAIVRVIDNPSGRTAIGLNLAIAASTAAFVARVDARSEIPPSYLAHALETLERTGAVNVGAIQLPVGHAPVQSGIAAAMTSRLGSGGAAYRGVSVATMAETGYLGVFRRDALDAVGGFDDQSTRNQDAELNLRLIREGGEVWVDPRMVVRYEPRNTLSKLFSQYWQYGWWRRRTAHKHRGSLRLRQLIPPTGLIAGVAAVLLAFWSAWTLLLPLGYALAVLAVSLFTRGLTLAERFVMAAALVTMHVSWAAGFLASSVSLLFRRR